MWRWNEFITYLEWGFHWPIAHEVLPQEWNVRWCQRRHRNGNAVLHSATRRWSHSSAMNLAYIFLSASPPLSWMGSMKTSFGSVSCHFLLLACLLAAHRQFIMCIMHVLFTLYLSMHALCWQPENACIYIYMNVWMRTKYIMIWKPSWPLLPQQPQIDGELFQIYLIVIALVALWMLLNALGAPKAEP